jgi:hypothetical protein
VNISPETAAKTAKWVTGLVAAVVSYFLIQPDVAVSPTVKVILSAILVVAAYINPATIADKIRGD